MPCIPHQDLDRNGVRTPRLTFDALGPERVQLHLNHDTTISIAIDLLNSGPMINLLCLLDRLSKSIMFRGYGVVAWAGNSNHGSNFWISFLNPFSQHAFLIRLARSLEKRSTLGALSMCLWTMACIDIALLNLT